jgi:ABC-2 type transport system ATP-binding protein
MSVWGYLEFFGRLRGLSGEHREERIDSSLAACRLEDEAETQIGKLSKGYRQRVGLAQAILHEPDVLILDEPTIGLDPIQIAETRNLIKELGKEHTIILCSHILPEVSALCGRVIILDEGRVVAVDTPQRLAGQVRGATRINIEVRGPGQEIASVLRQVPGVVAVSSQSEGPIANLTVDCAVGQDVREQLAALIVRSGLGLLTLQAAPVTLEEVFVRLTTREEATDSRGAQFADGVRQSPALRSDSPSLRALRSACSLSKNEPGEA